MIPIVHKVNTIKMLNKIPSNMGIEIDVRLYKEDIILSHDPGLNGEHLKNYLKEYNHKLLVVNIKETGIEKDVIDLMKKNQIENYFLLDVEFPFLLLNSEIYGKFLSLRYSKYEALSNLKGNIKWLWIDTYEDFEITNETLKMIKKFKVCMVSPSRWGSKEKYQLFVNKFKKHDIKIDYVMMDEDELKY